jgi:ribose transport system permease protein
MSEVDLTKNQERHMSSNHADPVAIGTNGWRAVKGFVGNPLDRSTALWVGLVTLGLFLMFGYMSNGVFFTAESIRALALDAAVSVILAVGMCLLLGAGQLDLSIGANVVLSTVAAAYVVSAIAGNSYVTTPSNSRAIAAGLAAAATCVASGCAFGLVNGLIVTKMRVNALIATLGTTGIAGGAVLVITNGVNIANFPPQLQTNFGNATIGGVLPYPGLIAVIVAIGVWIALRRCRFGVWTLAIGSSREAARRTGVLVDRMVLKLFILMGGLAGISGFIVMTRFGSTNVAGDETDALGAIAAAVIGGTSLFGGVASVEGSVIGALLPVILGSGLIVVGVTPFYQQIVIGGLLIVAVYIDQERRRRRLVS